MEHKVGDLYLHTPSNFATLRLSSDYVEYTLKNIENSSFKIPDAYYCMKDESNKDISEVSNEFITLFLPELYKNVSTQSRNSYEEIEGMPYYKYLTDRAIKNSVINDNDAADLEKDFILSMTMTEFEETLCKPYFENFLLAEKDFLFEYVKNFSESEYKEEVFNVLKALNDFCYTNNLEIFYGQRQKLVAQLNSSVSNCSGMGSNEKKERYKIGDGYYIMHFKLFRLNSDARIYFNFDESKGKIVLGKIGYHL